jgi:hypothetical protein
MYGSLINTLYSQDTATEPTVGMGVTILMWTDRNAGTITEVLRYKTGPKKGQVKGVKVRPCRAIRTDNLGMSDAQAYRYEEVPEWPSAEYTIRKDGSFRKAGCKYTQLKLGVRDSYYDYSF